MTALVIVIGVVAALAAVGWFAFNRQSPENTSRHEDEGTLTTSEQLYEGADRPAGPDVEPMDPDELGGDHRRPSV